MARHNETGAWGERLAREYYSRHGYAIVGEDVHMAHREVDIIAIKDNTVHFVEVKTRSDREDDPRMAITPKKIAAICRFADAYMRTLPVPYAPQFDVVAIIGSPAAGVETFEVIEKAFYPPLSRR